MRRALLALVLAAGCRPAPPTATEADASRSGIDVAELQHGRALLLSKCGASCHKVPLPSQHTPSEWPAKLDEMSVRAHLDRPQRELIEKYLVTMAQR